MCVCFVYGTNSRVPWCTCTHVLQENVTRSGASSRSLTLPCFSKRWYPFILPLLATVRQCKTFYMLPVQRICSVLFLSWIFLMTDMFNTISYAYCALRSLLSKSTCSKLLSIFLWGYFFPLLTDFRSLSYIPDSSILLILCDMNAFLFFDLPFYPLYDFFDVQKFLI